MCENLAYAVERLVRGLSSHREGARQGFAVCLTEVSAYSYYTVTTEDVNTRARLANAARKGKIKFQSATKGVQN